MRILQICHRVPYPAIDGANIAMMNLAASMHKAGAEVHMFALNTRKHFVEPASLPPEIIHDFHFKAGVVDTKVSPSGALKNFLGSGSYNVSRFYDVEVSNRLEEIVSSTAFDIIQFETIFATPYLDKIRKHTKAKMILRAHNAEHIIWQRLAEQQKNPFRKKYIRFLSGRLQKYEEDLLDKLDAIIPITSVDEQIFRALHFEKPMLTIPLGVDLSEYPATSTDAELCLFHLGSMDWMPNLEGVEWFLRSCWPPIHSEFPELKLYLAGRGFPEHISNSEIPGVHCEGRIANAVDYMREKQIMIVPLQSGSGMRVKIIQGLASGKTIISTTIGAEGIEIINGKNILIADSPEQYLQQVRACVSRPGRCREIGMNGRKLVEEKYTEERIGGKLLEFYRRLLQT